MTPEAQGAVERAAEVLAAHRLHDRRSDPRYPWCICGWEPERGGSGNDRIYNANLRHVAEALAAANLLATPPTASHDETALRNYLTDSRNALRAAAVIGARSCRDGDGLNYANHDRLVAEADRLLAARAAAGDADLAGES